MLAKPTPPAPGVHETGGFPDQSFEADFPTVYSYLCDASYSDGTARKTATITMFVDCGFLKACLNDRDNNRSAFVTGATLLELWDSLEAALSDPKTVWKVPRDDGEGKGRRPAKKS